MPEAERVEGARFLPQRFRLTQRAVLDYMFAGSEDVAHIPGHA